MYGERSDDPHESRVWPYKTYESMIANTGRGYTRHHIYVNLGMGMAGTSSTGTSYLS